MNVIGYLCVSTEEQARSGLGLEAQQATIEAAASHRGWRITWAIDAGHSAATMDRPALKQALADLANNSKGKRAKQSGEPHPRALVVAKLDRLSRSLPDFAHTMALARKQGWALVALDLGVDTTTPAGELARMSWLRSRNGNVALSVSAQARHCQHARLKACRSADHAWTPHTLDQIVALREANMTLNGIARHLNHKGTPTANGNGLWTGCTVARMLAAHVDNADALGA